MASPASSATSHESNPFAGPTDPAPPTAATLVLLNIRNHVPVVLSADDGNFRQWRSCVELTLKKFGLVNHIDGTVDAAAMIHDAEWLQVDACIVSWLYNTVSKEIWNDVNRPNATAYSVWLAITGQFLDNSLQRAVYAQQEFHSLYQGDMTVGEYCGRLKRLADTLYDCGAAVSDPALVINTLRGPDGRPHHHDSPTHLPLHQVVSPSRGESHPSLPPDGGPDGPSGGGPDQPGTSTRRAFFVAVPCSQRSTQEAEGR
jgi:hypothetical protein